ncbi:hypothetical protein P4679_23145 [Priestia megaterium]|uniref:hypothetical protein n=1 Tax=Priestia megaterium TaxID=1404 RepID=UPI002E20C07C|nr:hypothetical protein [Priestia megaterium]
MISEIFKAKMGEVFIMQSCDKRYKENIIKDNLVSLQEKREEDFLKAEKKDKLTEEDRKKRKVFFLNTTEGHLLMRIHLEYISLMINLLENNAVDEEEVGQWQKDVERQFSLLKKLHVKFNKVKPYEDAKMQWDYVDLGDTIDAVESSIYIEDGPEEYEEMSMKEKIANHLRYRLKRVNSSRLKLVNQELYPFDYELKNVPQGFREEKLKKRNIQKTNEYKYQQEFENNLVLIEEESLYPLVEDQIKCYYVMKHPANFRRHLVRLARKGTAKYYSKEKILSENSTGSEVCVFPSGWRISEDTIRAIRKSKAFQNVNLKVLSKLEYEISGNLFIAEMINLEKEIRELTQKWNNSKMKSFVSS